MITEKFDMNYGQSEYSIRGFLEYLMYETEYLKSYSIECVFNHLICCTCIIVELKVDEPIYIMERLLDETIDLKSQLRKFVLPFDYQIKIIINGEEK